MHWAIKQARDLIIWKSVSSTPPLPHLTVKIVNGEDEAQPGILGLNMLRQEDLRNSDQVGYGLK